MEQRNQDERESAATGIRGYVQRPSGKGVSLVKRTELYGVGVGGVWAREYLRTVQGRRHIEQHEQAK